MMIRNRISLFLATFLIIGFFFLALPEKGYSGTPPFPPGCCEYVEDSNGEAMSDVTVSNGGEIFCEEISEGLTCPFFGGSMETGFFPFEVCNEETGLCMEPPPPITTNVPTLSEWGLIAMAGILGIVGFMVIRRRKVTG